jgi:hypothetical protein
MKKILLVCCLSLLFACGQNHTAQEQLPSSLQVGRADTHEVERKQHLEEVGGIKPLKSEILKKEIATLYFVSDTIKNDFSRLIGSLPQQGGPQTDLPVMRCVAYEHNGKVEFEGLFELNDSVRIIPFFAGYDLEEMIFTKWAEVSDTTFRYLGRLEPRFPSKYSLYEIKERVVLNGDEFFIGEISSGEGGKMRSYIWTAKYNDPIISNFVLQHETSYFDGEENRKYLTYAVDGRDLNIIEVTDSLVYRGDSAVVFPLDQTVVKRVSLK